MGSQEDDTRIRPARQPDLPKFSDPLPSPDTSSSDRRGESDGHLEFNGHIAVPPRSSSLLTLTLSSIIAAGVQFGWALQLSLLTPYVQTLGIGREFLSFIWLCGPITGLVVQPCVGVWSDKCTMRLGRRRPFILGGALLICVAVTIIGFSADIGYLLGDSHNGCKSNHVACSSNRVARPGAIGVFVMGFWLLDLANNTVQGPARALLADLAGPEQRDTANSIFSLWMAIGNIIGFSTGASANWHKVFPRVITQACCEDACGNLKAAFLVATVFLIVCTSVTVCFSKEIPLVRTSRKMEDASPLLSSELEMLVEMQGVKLSTDMDRFTHNDVNGGRVEFRHAADHEEGESAGGGSGAVLVNLLTSIRHLPPQMKSVLMVMALCWLSWFPFFLFDTDWMGREVYRGDPCVEQKKVAYQEGVQRGTFGLLLNSVVLAVGSFFIDPLCRWFGPKLVWSISNFMISFGMASTALISALAGSKEETYAKWAKNAAIAFFAILGLPLAVTYSVPYSITAELASDSGGGQGVAMGVLNLAVVVPQMIVALGSSPSDTLFGGGNEPAFGFAALFGFAAGVVAWIKLPQLAHSGYTSAGGGHGFG